VPDTIIFDAGRGIWCRAGESALVRFIVTEAGHERPRLVTMWAAADAHAAPGEGGVTQTELFPVLQVAGSENAGVQNAPASAAAAPWTGSSGVPHRQAPARGRRRIVLTSLVTVAASVVAVALVLLQSETTASDVLSPGLAAMPSPPSVSFASSPDIGTAPESASIPKSGPSAASDLSGEGAAPLQVETTPPPEPVSIPAIPLLVDSQSLNGTLRAPNPSPLVALPAPPRPARVAEDRPAEPAFTQPPRVRNAGRVQQALEREYPIGLRELGIGGRVEMLFYIDEQGSVERFEIKQSSGNADLDRAAARVARVFEFTPALRGSQRVPGWFSLAIVFAGFES
jgi:TonB family protein